jgi:quercetin dioxygenase-like cupin family protein
MQIADESNESAAIANARPAARPPTAAPDICVQTIDAGASIAPHVHDDADELVCVLDGELSVRLGEREATLKAGMSAAFPRGLLHEFRNAGRLPARMLVVLASGQGARFLDALALARSSLPAEAANLASALVQRETYVVTSLHRASAETPATRGSAGTERDPARRSRARARRASATA